MRGSGPARTLIVLAVGGLLTLGGGLTGRMPALAERNPNPPPQQPPSQQPPPQQPPPQQQPPPRQGQDLYGCDRTFGHPPEGHLVKRTNPAGGATVHRGDSIVVAISWDPADWSGNRLHKVLDCVAIDGELQPSMQDGESPTENDGHFSTVIRVPGDVDDGAQICDQAMLSGPSPRGDYDRQISNQVCHTISGDSSGGCGGSRPCGGESSGGSPGGSPGGSRCDQGCARPPCDRCGEKQPCSSRGCAESPPCDRGCAERRPCDRRCGEAGCARSDSPDGDRTGCDHDGRRGKGCDCGRDRDREGLVRRLIHKLL